MAVSHLSVAQVLRTHRLYEQGVTLHVLYEVSDLLSRVVLSSVSQTVSTVPQAEAADKLYYCTYRYGTVRLRQDCTVAGYTPD